MSSKPNLWSGSFASLARYNGPGCRVSPTGSVIEIPGGLTSITSNTSSCEFIFRNSLETVINWPLAFSLLYKYQAVRVCLFLPLEQGGVDRHEMVTTLRTGKAAGWRSSLKWAKWVHVNKFVGEVAHLGFEGHGIFLLVLFTTWLTERFF